MTTPLSRFGGLTAAAFLFSIGTVEPILAVEPQADLVFDMLGPVACDMPPASFDIAQFRTFAENNPDAPIARGRIDGGLSADFAGGGVYGADGQGGFVVGVQGMLFDSAPELTMLCMVLVRLGDSDDTAGPIVGEGGMDAASDGSFLGVFKLVRRGADGSTATYAAGVVEAGTASFDIAEGILVDGSISIDGSYTPADGGETQALTVTIDIPRGENVIRPALRLSRD